MLFVFLSLCESRASSYTPQQIVRYKNTKKVNPKFYSHIIQPERLPSFPPVPTPYDVPNEYVDEYSDEYVLVDNGLGKKLKKAVKKVKKAVTKPVKKVVKAVTKPVEKTVKKTVHAISKVIYDTKSDMWAEPIKITSIQKVTENKDYTASDLTSLISTIVSEFSLDKTKLTNFFARAKFTNEAKTLLNTVEFGAKTDKRYRLGNLGVAALKVTKSGSSYTVNVKKASGNAEIWANTVKKSTKKILGASKSSKSVSWRPLTASELTQVYQTIQSTIASEIAEIKKI